MPAAGRRDVWARRYREINDWERYLVDQAPAAVPTQTSDVAPHQVAHADDDPEHVRRRVSR